MSIEHTLTNDWDLKLLTREEMLKDTTNRSYSVYKRMPAAVQGQMGLRICAAHCRIPQGRPER